MSRAVGKCFAACVMCMC